MQRPLPEKVAIGCYQGNLPLITGSTEALITGTDNRVPYCYSTEVDGRGAVTHIDEDGSRRESHRWTLIPGPGSCARLPMLLFHDDSC